MVVHDKNEPDLSKLVPIIIDTSTIDALTVDLGAEGAEHRSIIAE